MGKCQMKSSFFDSKLSRRIPILGWLPKYTKSDFISDFIAGITVGLTMMPQAIAYASLAGLQAQFGLYTAFIGSFTYVFLGTIKEVSIGPTSLMALLTFSYTEGLPMEFVVLLTFLAGCVEILIGLLKLGFLVDFMSPCVTSGFTSAMSITIVASQLKNIFGLKNLKNHGVFDVVQQVVLRYREIRLWDTVLAVACIAFLFSLKFLAKIKIQKQIVKKSVWILSISRNALIVLITSLIGFYFHEYRGGAPFILSGPVPQGLPQVIPPRFSAHFGNQTVSFVDMVGRLGSSVVVIPVVAVLANVAIAKTFSSARIIDATQEMITLGICNVLGSFVQAMPSCGAFTRSAVASSSGVRTPLQGLYSGTIILLALSFLTPYFFYIPRSTLGAVLISAIITMFDYEIFPRLWKCNKFDFWLTFSTLVVGVFYGVEVGIIAGSLMNLLVLLKNWNRPRIFVETKTDENTGQMFIYIRPELGLYYPAIDFLTTRIAKAHYTSTSLPIVLDCEKIIKIDYAGCLTIENLLKIYSKKKVRFTLHNVNPSIYRVLKKTIDLDNVEFYSGRNNNCVAPEISMKELTATDNKLECIADSSGAPLLANNNERKMSCYDNV